MQSFVSKTVGGISSQRWISSMPNSSQTFFRLFRLWLAFESLCLIAWLCPRQASSFSSVSGFCYETTGQFSGQGVNRRCPCISEWERIASSLPSKCPSVSLEPGRMLLRHVPNTTRFPAAGCRWDCSPSCMHLWETESVFWAGWDAWGSLNHMVGWLFEQAWHVLEPQCWRSSTCRLSLWHCDRPQCVTSWCISSEVVQEIVG